MSAITTAEILLKYSVAAAAGNTTASSPGTSLGDQISTTVWPAPGALNDLFDNISAAENAASVADYRCIFVHNSNTANPLENAVVFLTADVPGGANIALGVDPTPASAIGAASAQAVAIANETTLPAGVTFVTTAVSAATGVALGTIDPGFCRAFWVLRAATNSAAKSGDGGTINVAGESGSL